MKKPKLKVPLDAVSVLRMVRDDLLEFETVAVDGRLVLIRKADVIDLLRDWTEYCLNPDDTTLATQDH